MDGKIIFFIGRSGSGKDTFFKKTLEIYQVEPITLFTTRPKRPGEQEGTEYYFISMEKMNLLEKRNLLIERRNYNTVYGEWSYATGIEQVNLNLYNYVTLNTWEGYARFQKKFNLENLIPVYITMDEGTLLQRSLNRERQGAKNYQEMCRRFLNDAQDYTQQAIDYYKPFIIDNNGSIEETQSQIDDLFTNRLQIAKKKRN